MKFAESVRIILLLIRLLSYSAHDYPNTILIDKVPSVLIQQATRRAE